ncbi:MAG: DUF2065 domain-containing protein [Aquabacterium sp.]
MSDFWLPALGLLLIFEGLGPLLLPAKWRDWFRRALELSDGQLRFLGLVCVALGLLLLATMG